MDKELKEQYDQINVTIGQKIKEQRSKLGVSQSELANYLGITFQQLQKYEKGLNRCSGSSLVLIAEKLNFNIGDFLNGLKVAPEVIDETVVMRVKMMKRVNQLTPQQIQLIGRVINEFTGVKRDDS